MSEPTHDPELIAVERALAGLAPSAGGIDRNALMFAAGRASARRGWGWPGAAAGSALVAAVLAALLLLWPAPEPRLIVVTVNVPRAESAPRPPEESLLPDETPPPRKTTPLRPETDYLTLRHAAERWGDAGLPAALSTADEQPVSSDPLLDLPPDVRADPWLQRRTALLTPGGSL